MAPNASYFTMGFPLSLKLSICFPSYLLATVYFKGYTGEICIKAFCYFIAVNEGVITFAAPEGFILFRGIVIVFEIVRNVFSPQQHHTISLMQMLLLEAGTNRYI